MGPRIHKSRLPSVTIPECSLFTYLFAEQGNLIGGRDGSLTAYVDAATGTVLTRRFVRDTSLSVAQGLHKRFALKQGETIMIFSPNSVAFGVVFHGLIAGGFRATLANSAYTAAELEHQYKDSQAKLIFTTEENLPVALEMFKRVGLSPSDAAPRIVIIDAGFSWAGGPHVEPAPAVSHFAMMSDLLKMGRLAEEVKFDGRQAHETILLCYSSGTTGKPKGVETTHHNIVSLVQMLPPLFPARQAEDRLLGILPLYHIYGATKLMIFPLTVGIPMYLMSRFEPVQFCQNIEKHKITHVLVAPPVMVVLARLPAVDKFDMSTLRILISGAAPLGDLLVKDVMNRLLSLRKGTSKTPLAILQGYGLTETSPTTHMLPEPDTLRKIGSIGVLLPNLEARLVSDDEEHDVAEGEPGELWIRGPTVMKGYLNNPSATKASITEDGWFKTGDIAIKDQDEYFFIKDRKKELVKYKGFQVPPAELESVLLSHPDIADCAVIGVYDEQQATELPRAYVVHANPKKLTSDADNIEFSSSVVRWMETKVARHKFLRGGVILIDAIPKSAAGKILRRELRDAAKADVAANGGAARAKL